MIFKGLLIKEWKLISRDLHALAVLFIMPAAFLLLMSAALSEVNQNTFPKVDIQLSTSSENNSDPQFFEAALQAILEEGRLLKTTKEDLPSLTLPAGFSEHLLDETQPALSLVYPATTDRMIRQRIRGAVELALAHTRLHAFLADIGDLDENSPIENRLFAVQQYTYAEINESDRLSDGQINVQPSAVQHSVPAWLIFGMFFIMLPMANSFLQEQRSGVLLRLQTLGLKLPLLLASKLLPYAVINLVQFIFLLLLGLYCLPLLGLPALVFSGSLTAWLLLVFSLTLATTSLGLVVAGLAKTGEQALLISGGLNLLLAAIGGIMVPRSVMPLAMQEFSKISPMSWALDAFTELLAGQGGVAVIALWCSYLLLFSLLCGGLGLLLFRRRLKENQWTTTN